MCMSTLIKAYKRFGIKVESTCFNKKTSFCIKDPEFNLVIFPKVGWWCERNFLCWQRTFLMQDLLSDCEEKRYREETICSCHQEKVLKWFFMHLDMIRNYYVKSDVIVIIFAKYIKKGSKTL